MKQLFTLFLLVCPFLAISQALHMSPNTALPAPTPAVAPVRPPDPEYKELPHAKLQVPSNGNDQQQADYTKQKAENDAINAENGKLRTDYDKKMAVYNKQLVDYGKQLTTGGTTTITRDAKSVIISNTTTGGTTIDFNSRSITMGSTLTGGTTDGGTESVNGTITTITGGKTTGGTMTGGVTEYNAWVMSTNFTVPLVRVNFLVNKPQNATNSKASASFLNAAGAGITFSKGRLDVTKDNTNKQTSVDFYNTFGFQAGFLFASNSTAGSSASQTGTSNTTTTQSSTVFAIMGGISVLNFSLDAGYELGSLASGQRRGFLAIAYAIPISALIDGGYKVLGINKLSKRYSY